MGACCQSCAESGLGDLGALSVEPDKKVLFVVGGAAVVGLAALMYLFPEKRRTRRKYRDPYARRTAEIPVQSMREMVYGRTQR